MLSAAARHGPALQQQRRRRVVAVVVVAAASNRSPKRAHAAVVAELEQQEVKQLRGLSTEELQLQLKQLERSLGLPPPGAHRKDEKRHKKLLARLAAARVAARARAVRLPLRLTLAGRGRRYLTFPVDVAGVGWRDMLLDAGAWLPRVTPELRDALGYGVADGVLVVSGGGGGGSTSAGAGAGAGVAAADEAGGEGADTGSNSSSSSSSSSTGGGGGGRLRLRQRVPLPPMFVGHVQLPGAAAHVAPLALPPRRPRPRSSSSSSSSAAAATDTTGAGAAAAAPRPPSPSASGRLDIGGLLGLEFLWSCELGVDVPSNAITIAPAGAMSLGLVPDASAAATAAAASPPGSSSSGSSSSSGDSSSGGGGLVPVPCRLTRHGAIVLPVALGLRREPFLGIVDLSAATTVLNWPAAEACFGMRCRDAVVVDDDAEEEEEQGGGGGGEGSASASGSSSSSSSSGGVGEAEQRQQQRHRRRRPPRLDVSGCFGSVDVQPDEPLLQRPQLPRVGGGGDADGSSSSSSSSPQALAATAPPPSSPPRAATPGGAAQQERQRRWSGGGGGSSASSRASSLIQRHEVPARGAALTLGSSASPGKARLRLQPPPRFGVAPLQAVANFGIDPSTPVAVLGADVLLRHRAVLCLKAGCLWLADAPHEEEAGAAA